jgi:hypothetical protein
VKVAGNLIVKKESLNVQGTEISVFTHRQNDYISLTDMARYKNAEATGLVISHWLSTRYTVEFMGVWEKINNPNFNVTELSNIKKLSQSERLIQLNNTAITQMKSLVGGIVAKRLK